jgi:hypothetical protein
MSQAVVINVLLLLPLQLCNDWALGGKGGIKKVKGDIWGASTVVLSFLDWPLRRCADMGMNIIGYAACCDVFECGTSVLRQATMHMTNYAARWCSASWTGPCAGGQTRT